MRLNKREKSLLQKELEKAKKINQRINGTLLPEEKKLIDRKYPSGGIHLHDEDNPFGMHRHFLEDSIDGAHIHTTQNPKGEHVHGHTEGRALIDGGHTHDDGGTGYHWHDYEEDDGDKIIPQRPESIL